MDLSKLDTQLVFVAYPNGYDIYKSMEEAEAAYQNDFDGTLAESGMQTFTIDYADFSQMEDHVMSILFSDEGELITDMLNGQDRAILSALCELLADYNRIYDAGASSFSDEGFRIYEALCSYEDRPVTGLRRKESSKYNTQYNGRFVIDLPTCSEHVEMSDIKKSAKQFKLLGLRHPLAGQLKHGIVRFHQDRAHAEKSKISHAEYEVLQQQNAIKSLEQQLAQAKQKLADMQQGVEAAKSQLAQRQAQIKQEEQSDLATFGL